MSISSFFLGLKASFKNFAVSPYGGGHLLVSMSPSGDFVLENEGSEGKTHEAAMKRFQRTPYSLFCDGRWTKEITKATWESLSEISQEEFKNDFSSFLAANPGLEFYGLPSTSNMTLEQQRIVMEVLSQQEPGILGRFSEHYVHSSEQLKDWIQFLSQNAPETFLYYAGRQYPKDCDVHKLLDDKVKSALSQVITQNPEKGHWYQFETQKSGLTFPQEQRNDFFSKAALKDPKYLDKHAEYWNPSKVKEDETYQRIFKTCLRGSAPSHQNAKSDPYHVLLAECFPERIFARVQRVNVSEKLKGIAFNNLVLRNPDNIVLYDNEWFNDLTSKQRLEALELAAKKDAGVLPRLNYMFSRLPEKERVNLENLYPDIAKKQI